MLFIGMTQARGVYDLVKRSQKAEDEKDNSHDGERGNKSCNDGITGNLSNVSVVGHKQRGDGGRQLLTLVAKGSDINLNSVSSVLSALGIMASPDDVEAMVKMWVGKRAEAWLMVYQDV